MLTKGAIGNLVNRYRAVLKKCNLINTFGSLAMASMLVLGGAAVANAADVTGPIKTGYTDYNLADDTLTVTSAKRGFEVDSKNRLSIIGTAGSEFSVTAAREALFLASGSHYFEAETINLTSTGTNAIYVNSGSKNAEGELIPTTIKGKNVTITGAVNAIQNASEGGPAKLVIDAENLTLNAKARAIRAVGDVTLNAHNLTITQAEEEIAASGKAVIDITATGLAQIDASLSSKSGGGTVKLNIAGEGSYIKGALNNNVEVTLNEGAAWEVAEAQTKDNPDGTSSFSKLTSFGGLVDMSKAQKDITVTDLAGNDVEVLMDAAATNTFTVSNDSATAVTATATENADYVTDKQAQEMVNRIDGADNKSALIEEGKTRGAMSVGADGTITTARNTLMDAALQQASVNTVALDKILTNDVRKRLGDIRADQNKSGVWMRWDGGKLKGNSGLTNNFNTIQIGADTKVATNCRLGVAGSFTHGDGDFARGSSELEGFSFAGYATWMGDNGMFADVVARLGHFSTEMNVEGEKGDMDNRVASLSAEYGWRFNVCDQFFVEPQIELAYTYVSSEDLELGTTRYSFDSVDSLTGRAGLVAGWNLPNDRGSVYARASVVQQFMGDAKITGAVTGGLGNIQELDGEDTWLEYGIGANVKLTDKTYLWADVERTEGADVDEEWRGTVGVRFSF